MQGAHGSQFDKLTVTLLTMTRSGACPEPVEGKNEKNAADTVPAKAKISVL
jgi:hypothetical protein